MPSPKRFCLATIVLFATLAGAQTGKVEPLAGFADSNPSPEMKNALDPKGYRLSLDDGTVVCDLWLRKTIPAQPKHDVPGALYTQIPDSAFIGVISFPQAAADYRGQSIKAGTYALRYALLPNDGNHLGVAPNRDFLLLVPANSDPDPAKIYKFEELVSLSRTAAGTHHPAPLSLVQSDHVVAAAFVRDDEDHWVFSVGLKLSNGDELPMALVLKGTAPQ
ncbi:MAG TPA: hypothetical protein VFA68_07280 [Terriglobales bacterium]|nr:hypothetical protein [Terriglobales bacterium]